MNRNKLLKNLDQLDALFVTPEKWIQGSFARDKSGHTTTSNDRNAICWCLQAGINRVTYMDNEAYAQLRDALSKTANGMHPINFNDLPNRTFAEVKKLISDTKARIKEEAASEISIS